jgi:hypothetical protein
MNVEYEADDTASSFFRNAPCVQSTSVQTGARPLAVYLSLEPLTASFTKPAYPVGTRLCSSGHVQTGSGAHSAS